MITGGRGLLWYNDSFVEALHESLVDVAREGENGTGAWRGSKTGRWPRLIGHRTFEGIVQACRGRAAASVHLIYSATAGSVSAMRVLLGQCAPRAITKSLSKTRDASGD